MKENNKEKNLVKYEEGIFYKIKSFFRRLFRKEEVFVVEVSESNKDVLELENKGKSKTFKEEIVFYDGDAKLMKLQEQFEAGEISEDDLSSEQVQSLTKLYNEQIDNLKASIKNCKEEILLVKNRLKVEG